MPTTFWRNGENITNDFIHVQDGTEYQIPFQNLLVWDDATLASYGITKTVTPDVPAEISDRQFFQQLAVVGTITQDEALAAVKTGTIPPALSGFLASLPEADRFSAEMLLSGATTFYRAHPLVDAVAAAQGMTAEQVDAFFIAAAQL